MNIAIHSAPRSGSSWLGEIFNSAPDVCYKFQPMFSYRFRGLLGTHSTAEDISGFFKTISNEPDAFCDQLAARTAGNLPTFAKTVARHNVYKEVRFHHLLCNLVRVAHDARFVLMIRNPMAVISSWLLAPREFRVDHGWRCEEEWRYALKKNLNRPEEFNGYEKWKEATNIFEALAGAYPDRVRLVWYGNLLKQTEAQVRALFDFCGIEYGEQTERFIEESTSRMVGETYGVFNARSADNGWKANLPSYIVEAIIKDLFGTKLEKYLE